jgi:hypothetical protein
MHDPPAASLLEEFGHPIAGPTRSVQPTDMAADPHDPARRAVWIALADLFLDTDTTSSIPVAARACVDAGYSASEARIIWRHEVTPALWPNIWSVAGEWAGWDEAWLVDRIERQRGRWPNRPGAIGSLIYRLRAGSLEETWRAIERCMRALEHRGPGSRTDD